MLVYVSGAEPSSEYWFMYLELNLATDTAVYVPGAEPGYGYWYRYLELNLAPDTGICTLS